MKKNLLICLLLFFSFKPFAQDFGFWASAVGLNINHNLTYYDTYDTSDANRIGNLRFSDDVPYYVYYNFEDSIGTFVQNSGTLQINGGIIKTFKNSNSNVCGATLFFTIYPEGSRPAGPIYTPIGFNFLDNCLGNTFPYDGSACSDGDQEWGDTSTVTGIDLTTVSPGNYTLEVYYQIPGSYTSTSACGDTVYDNNNNPSTNYTANFTIISGPLALNLLNFAGDYQKDAVSLNWNVENGLNQKGFEIERSADGKLFNNLSFESAKTSNNSINSYSYIDNNLPGATTLFYRLKIESSNGMYSYSNVLPVKINQLNNDNVSIMLTQNNLQLNLGSAIGNNSLICLTDLEGRSVVKQALNAQPAGSSISIPLSQAIVRGVYIVSIYDGASGNVITKKAEPLY